MLNSRKITTKVFSKLTDLPKEIVEYYGRKESDDVIIFSPPERYREGKGKYYCTKCGTKGETNEDSTICSHCGNTAYHMEKQHFCRSRRQAYQGTIVP